MNLITVHTNNLLLNCLLVLCKKFQKSWKKWSKMSKLVKGGHFFCYTLYTVFLWLAKIIPKKPYHLKCKNLIWVRSTIKELKKGFISILNGDSFGTTLYSNLKKLYIISRIVVGMFFTQSRPSVWDLARRYILKSYALEEGSTGLWKSVTSGSIEFDALRNPGMCYLQSKTFAYTWLLNKPYKNEIIFREHKKPLKCYRPLDISNHPIYIGVI